MRALPRQDSGLPDQTVTSLNQDLGQLASDGLTDLANIVDGAISGDDTSDKHNTKREAQVVKGIEDEIAQDLAGYIPQMA